MKKAIVVLILAGFIMAGYFIYTTSISPPLLITRSNVVRTLAEFHRVDVSSYLGCVFEDVDDASSDAPYIEWARHTGIVGGFGNNEFQPGAAISRQDFLVVLNNYIDYLGLALPEIRSFYLILDGFDVADYAWRSVDVAHRCGIMPSWRISVFRPRSNTTTVEAESIWESFRKVISQANRDQLVFP